MRIGYWLGLLMIFGCPSGNVQGPATACTKAYDKCVLPSGVLGVCDAVSCAEGQPEPCLVCRSQH